MPKTVIIVPVYNEALRLDLGAFRRFLTKHDDYDFLFVDDGSKDQTSYIIQQFCHQENYGNRISLCKLPINQGKAEAVRFGIIEALTRKASYIGYWDADLATPLETLPRFLETFATHPHVELVMGSRVKLLGRDIKRYPWRHYVGRVFATFASITLRLAVYDTQCGAKVFKVSDKTKMIFSEKFHSRWIFDVEILARYSQLRASELSDSRSTIANTLYELVLDRWEDKAGSKVNLKAYGRSLYDLAYIFLKYRPGKIRRI